MLSLPRELLFDIIIQLSLKDIYHVLLTNSYFNIKIKINWEDYFLYHTGIDKKILNNFGTIDENFMIEHGRYLLDKSIRIIKQYLILYPKLIALNLLDNAIEYIRYNQIEYSVDDNRVEMLQFYFEGKCGRFLAIYFSKNNDGTMQYTRATSKDVFMSTLGQKTANMSFLYDECKDILLFNDLYYFTTILGSKARIFKIDS